MTLRIQRVGNIVIICGFFFSVRVSVARCTHKNNTYGKVRPCVFVGDDRRTCNIMLCIVQSEAAKRERFKRYIFLFFRKRSRSRADVIFSKRVKPSVYTKPFYTKTINYIHILSGSSSRPLLQCLRLFETCKVNSHTQHDIAEH